MAALAATSTRLRRVVLTGSESTGKTELAPWLATRYGAPWVPEFSREYAERKGTPLDASDVEPIARGQIAGEDAGAGRATGLLVLDTDLVSTVVYATHYYGSCPEWIERTAKERLADLYLLCDIDMPWVAGPQRDQPRARGQLHEMFRSRLETFGARYVIVRGGWGERYRIASDAVDELVGAVR